MLPDLTPAQPYLARRQNWTNQLTRHALMQPNDTALRFLGRTTIWRELDDRVTALASSLSRRGVQFGDRVLILMLNRTEFIESFLAINKLGARRITTEDARQLPRNAHVVVRNPREQPPGKRRLLVGTTDGGRTLTLVIERTIDPRPG